MSKWTRQYGYTRYHVIPKGNGGMFALVRVRYWQGTETERREISTSPDEGRLQARAYSLNVTRMEMEVRLG